ncbi:hypothetical protein HNP40_001565 [Mycobacteroides chelonae]|nr:hypothetical protein [Mycobacteroides chelonae]
MQPPVDEQVGLGRHDGRVAHQLGRGVEPMIIVLRTAGVTVAPSVYSARAR